MEHTGTPEEIRTAILRALRQNGRASYARIGAAVGVPRKQVARVVQQALDQGELRLTVSISPDLLGLERFAYLQLTVDGPVEAVRDALARMPETTFVADISGSAAIDAEIRVGADPHLRATVDSIRGLPGVRELRTHLYESIEVNLHSPLRTGRTAFAIDDADRIIVQRLQEDGRASFRALGEAAGVSPSGARLRLDRLTRHGAVKVVGIPVRGSRSELPSLGVGIRVGGRLEDAIASVRGLDPEFLAVTIGEYDLIATLSADDPEALLALADGVRSLDEVSTVETWANLRIVKEQYGEGDRISASPRTRPGGDPEDSRRLRSGRR